MPVTTPISSSSGAKVSTRNYLDSGARRLLPQNHWFVSAIADFLQSSEQGIRLQSTFGGGVGRYLTNSDHAVVACLAAWHGKAPVIISPTSRHRSKTLPPAWWTRKPSSSSSAKPILTTATVLPALSDPGRLRFNTDASYYIKLVSNLKWNLSFYSFYGNWDNRPPPGFSGSDYGTSSGISWAFGVK